MLIVKLNFKKKEPCTFSDVSNVKYIGNYIALINSLDEIIFGVNVKEMNEIEVKVGK